MSKYTITPWRTQKDLLVVRQQLYRLGESSEDHRRHAVDRVMAWKMRGNLPHAVESTALLIDAILHYDIPGNSTFSVRAVYSAAFCRFVTGFCDIGRHRERSLEPSSMLDIARSIDMPLEFVALRHEATHEELPGIQRLMSATEQALDWLWRVYWSRLPEPEDLEATKAALPALKGEAATLLRAFRKSRRDALRSNLQNSPEQLQEVTETSMNCATLCGDSDLKRQTLADVLVHDRLLLPSNRELGSPLEGAYMIWDAFLEDLSLRLPNFVRELGMCLLQRLAQPAAVHSESDAEKEALAQWVLHLFDTEAEVKDWRGLSEEVLRWCCLHPGYWTERIGHGLIERGDSELRNDWLEMLEASSLGNGRANVVMSGDDKIPIEHTKRIVDVQEVELSVLTETGSWRRPILPVDVPIGVVP